MTYNTQAQQPLTPEKLWEVQRVGGIGLTPDKKQVLLSVTTPNVAENSFKKGILQVGCKWGQTDSYHQRTVGQPYHKYNADKSLKLIHKSVKINPVLGKDFYKELSKSTG